MTEAGWPDGRPLRLATPADFEPIARLVASDIEQALELTVGLTVVPEDQLLVGARALVEKQLDLPWDVVHFWFDLSSELPPAAVHREFFGSDGAFRAGPECRSSIACLPRALPVRAAGALRGQPPRPLLALRHHIRAGRDGGGEEHWSRRGGG